MSEQANTAVIMTIYEAFSRGDIPAVLDTLDPQADLSFEGPSSIPWTGQYSSRDGWVKFFQTLAENMEEIALQMTLFAAQGDNVVMTGRYQARVKKTGQRIDTPLVHLWTVRNGKVIRCQEMTNTAAEAAACTSAAAAH